MIYNGKTIFDLYARPSQEKIKIYFEREKKLDAIYWLTGNNFRFYIFGSITDENWQKHNVKITPSYNYID